MRLSTRRICANVADARRSAATLEALESRRLLTAVAGDDDAADPSHWNLVDPTGASQATATLEDGILKVTATGGNDEISLGTHQVSGHLYVMVNGTPILIDSAAVRGIKIFAGDGDDCLDFFNFGGVVDVPVTVYGGAGNDSLVAQRDRNNHDDPIAFEGDGPFARVTLVGGGGDDDLHAGIGDCLMVGGADNDTFERGWGHDKIRDKDDAKAPKAEAPPGTLAPTPVVTTPTKADDRATTHAAPPASMPVPTTISGEPFAGVGASLFHVETDDVLSATSR